MGRRKKVNNDAVKYNYDDKGNVIQLEAIESRTIQTDGRIHTNKIMVEGTLAKPKKILSALNPTTMNYEETSGAIAQDNQYKIDYANGDIYFHNSQIGTNIKTQFMYIGEKLGDASEIYVNKNSDGTVTKSLTEEINYLADNIKIKADSDKVFDYVFSPQNNIPAKQGKIQSSPLLVFKREINDLLVLQRTNKGYLRHTINSKNGCNTDSQNYGKDGGHELMRLVDTRPLESVYTYKDIATPKTGTLAVYQAPTLNGNVLEQSLLNISERRDDRNISSKAGNFGCGIYSMIFNNEITYDMKYTYCNKGNLAFMVSPTSVEVVKIYINNILVKQFNPRMWLKNGVLSYGIVEFELPTLTTTATYELKIRAEGSSGYFYPCAINFYELEMYNNQDVDNWKGFGSSKGGYLTTGANDYALADNENRWFGSFHGGERLEVCQLTWSLAQYPKLDSNIYQETLDNISVDEWRILESFQIYQKTDLINKAKMHNILEFSTDGTVDMKFSFMNYGNVLLNAFCTALTCTDTKFSYLFMPEFKFLGDAPSGKDISIPLSEGFIRQVNPTDKMQLDIRFTKFHELNNVKSSYILDHSFYRKFYYNVVSNVKNVNISTLQFSKALDFTIR